LRTRAAATAERALRRGASSPAFAGLAASQRQQRAAIAADDDGAEPVEAARPASIDADRPGERKLKTRADHFGAVPVAVAVFEIDDIALVGAEVADAKAWERDAHLFPAHARGLLGRGGEGWSGKSRGEDRDQDVLHGRVFTAPALNRR
jgi:hypothetical protein